MPPFPPTLPSSNIFPINLLQQCPQRLHTCTHLNYSYSHVVIFFVFYIKYIVQYIILHTEVNVTRSILMLALTRFQSFLTSNHCLRLPPTRYFARRCTYPKATQIQPYSMAHPTASSSQDSQPQIDSPHAGNKAPKEKKVKPANTSEFPLEVRSSSSSWFSFNLIINELASTPSRIL